ncbi:MAG: PAS domain-containing protein [Burkholderiales bacterium]
MYGAISVLVVVSDGIVQRALTRELDAQEPPYRIQVADSVAATRHLLSAGPFDVILADHILPDGTLSDLIESTLGRPIIAIADALDANTALRELGSGVSDFLTKVAQGHYLKLLQQRIELVFRRWRAAQQSAQSEAALRAANKRLSLALSSSQLTLWDYDARAGMMYLSREWAQILEREAQESFSYRLDELQALVHPDDVATMHAQMLATLKGTQATYSLDQRIRTASGRWKWIHSDGTVTERDAAGRALRGTGTNVDIDLRKCAEEKLATAARQLREMTHGIPGAVYQFQWIEGKRPRINFISAGVSKLMGVDFQEVERDATKVFAATVDEDRAGFVASLSEATAAKASNECDPRHAGVRRAFQARP